MNPNGSRPNNRTSSPFRGNGPKGKAFAYCARETDNWANQGYRYVECVYSSLLRCLFREPDFLRFVGLMVFDLLSFLYAHQFNSIKCLEPDNLGHIAMIHREYAKYMNDVQAAVAEKSDCGQFPDSHSGAVRAIL